MARTLRNQKLDSRSARTKLPQKKGGYWASVAKGCAIGYRSGTKGGTWLAKFVRPGFRRETAIGPTDDVLDADGIAALDFPQAQAKAREWFARMAKEADGGPAPLPLTLKQVLDDYEGDLQTRKGDTLNVVRVRAHMPPEMLSRMAGDLTSAEFKRWRDDLASKLAPSTVNRTTTGLKAALRLAARNDETLAEHPWKTGLVALGDAQESHNVILSDDIVRSIVASAYELPAPVRDLTAEDHAMAEKKAEASAACFGLLIEVLAVTGTRISQAARLIVGDLQDQGPNPRLMMPTSLKGRGTRKASHHPVPIPASLAARLRAAAKGKSPKDLLLVRPDGEPWRRSNHTLPFARMLRRLLHSKLGEATALKATAAEIAQISEAFEGATLYSLRHSSIVRQLLAGVPARVVAAGHNTSIVMLERTYSAKILDHSDAVSRRAMLDMSPPTGENVVSLHG